MKTITGLQARIITKVETDNDTYIRFYRKDGKIVTMRHHQDCCEDARINDINGDLESLVNSTIWIAEERVNLENDSETWTFYTLRTIKGSVDIR